MFDEKRKQTRRTTSLRRDSARGVAGDEHAVYPCPALPFSGCLIEHEHENDDSMIKSAYDVVILGAGHNGLVAASYLGRAGLSVLLLEKNHYIGGATTSQKVFSDYDARLSRVFAGHVWDTMLEPLLSKEDLRRRFDVDDVSREAWRSLAVEPLGVAIEGSGWRHGCSGIRAGTGGAQSGRGNVNECRSSRVERNGENAQRGI